MLDERLLMDDLPGKNQRLGMDHLTRCEHGRAMISKSAAIRLRFKAILSPVGGGASLIHGLHGAAKKLDQSQVHLCDDE